MSTWFNIGLINCCKYLLTPVVGFFFTLLLDTDVSATVMQNYLIISYIYLCKFVYKTYRRNTVFHQFLTFQIHVRTRSPGLCIPTDRVATVTMYVSKVAPCTRRVTVACTSTHTNKAASRIPPAKEITWLTVSS